MVFDKTVETLPSPIYSIRSLSLLQELGIINLSGHDIWISDSSKQSYCIKNKACLPHEHNYISIYLRTNAEADKRKFDYNGIEIPTNNGFKVTKYLINIKHFLSKGHIYIEDIGMSLAFTRQDAEAYNLSSSVYQERHYKNLVEIFKTAMTMAPFKVMCNDPYCKLHELWTIINNKPFAIDITHIRDEPEQCKVYLGIKPGDYSVTDIKFDSLIKGEYIFDCDDTKVMLFPTREMAVKHIFKSQSNLAVFTYEDLQNKIKEYKTNYELEIDKYKKLNAELTNKNNILQQDNIILRQQINDYFNNQYKERLHRESLEREKYKTEKERLSYNASNSSSLSTIIKSIATIIPVIASIAGLLFMKKKT